MFQFSAAKNVRLQQNKYEMMPWVVHSIIPGILVFGFSQICKNRYSILLATVTAGFEIVLSTKQALIPKQNYSLS